MVTFRKLYRVLRLDGMFSMNDKTKGAFLTITGGACWGISGAIGQYLFTYEGMDAHWLVPVRLGLAGIVLLVYSFLRHGKEALRPWKTKQDCIDLLIYGIAGVSMCQYFYFRTIQLSSAAVGTILQDLSPVLIMAASCALEHRYPEKREVLAVVLALSGVFLLSTHGNPGELAIAPAALLTGILSAVCVTIYNVYPGRLLRTYPVHLLQGWAFLSGSILFTFLFRAWTYPTRITPAGALGIAFVVLIGNVLAFLFYMQGVKLIGPTRSILYGFSEPLTAAVLTVLVFHQPVTLPDIAGFLLIFGMIVLISKEPEKKADGSALME